jgi:hypothetical protein
MPHGDSSAKYPVVAESHFVPRTYLRAWLDDRRLACVHLVKAPAGAPSGFMPRPKEKGAKGIAVRRAIYARERPRTGETIHDVEWSLSQGENAFGPLLQSIRQRWPFSHRDKGILAEFLGFQAVRGPRNLDQLERLLLAGGHTLASAGDHIDPADDARLTVESRPAAPSASTRQMTAMMLYGKIATVALGSMHWTLIEFGDGALLTSDHPVHLWPLETGTLRPAPPSLPGALSTLEMRVPLSPSLALLGTWQVEADPIAPIVGNDALARSLNTCLIAQADEQWLHVPGSSPPRRSITDRVGPWSAFVLDGYDARTARRSARRRAAAQIIRPMLDAKTPPQNISLVFVDRR